MNILKAADKIVNQRQEGYDKPERNFQRIADLWTGYGKGKGWQYEFTPHDVAAFMILVKLGREVWKHKTDNCIDIAGYAQCMDEIGGDAE